MYVNLKKRTETGLQKKTGSNGQSRPLPIAQPTCRPRNHKSNVSRVRNYRWTIARIEMPPPNGLPIYSASGFDLLSILARVHNRPNVDSLRTRHYSSVRLYVALVHLPTFVIRIQDIHFVSLSGCTPFKQCCNYKGMGSHKAHIRQWMCLARMA